ncbi:MAG: peptidase M6 [Actinomycetota bacterium]
MHQRSTGLAAAILLLAALVPSQAALAMDRAAPEEGVDIGVEHLPPDVKVPELNLAQARRAVRTASSAVADPQSAVGDTKLWPAIDFITGTLDMKEYTLRGVGTNIEVWVLSGSDDVSTGTDFPAGDCRNGARTEITDEQVQYLIDEFDGNIYPKESEAFSVPPARDGTDSELAAALGLATDYYQGDGDDIAVLVDNVRDDNFYDTDNQNTLSYVAGFYSSFFDDVLNRLTMTIDAYDWLHRTGANPPHEPTTDPCTSAPARPFLYEGVFAHEYQHLLQHYVDPGETTWVNEGLSDWAQTLTGYVDPSVPITDLGYDSHVQCFLGYLGVQTDFNPIPRDGGPENSLTLWGDQTDFESEILCDYGAAYTMMESLAGRFGEDFMGELHRDPLHGLQSVQALAQAAGSDQTIDELVDEWATTMALDGILDDGAKLKGGSPADFQVPTLDATINWDTDQTYSSPGAPPNGSDYVRLRDGSSQYLAAGDIDSIEFAGVAELPSLPIEWVVDPEPPGHAGDPALFSGTGDNLDRSIVQEVTVPGASPTLSFDANWSLEDGFDYAYVQVSTDGGESYEAIECSGQVQGGGPLGPAFNGESGAFMSSTCDLSAFAGQTVVISFRLVTDGSFFLDGFWVDDVMLGGALLSDGSSLDEWSSPTELNPVDIEGYTVRLIAHREGKRAWIAEVPLDEGFSGVLQGGPLRKAIGTQAGLVAAIVTYHDSTETIEQYAPYTLLVNGAAQPGG